MQNRLYNKRLEDPLANIRKSEKSMKERLLANPVKMKKMRAIFEEMLKDKVRGQEEKRERKEAKLRKKAAKSKDGNNKSRKRKVENGETSDSESEDDANFETKRMAETQRNLMRLKHSGLGEAPGTSKNWNQTERYKSSYANRLVNKDDDPNYVHSKPTTNYRWWFS